MDFQRNVDLSKWTFWKIGGPADYFCLPQSLAELKSALKFAQEKKIPVTMLGGGTNVLVSDGGIDGLVICTRRLVGTETVEVDGHLKITAWAGTPKSELTKIFLRRKLAPALFLCGLPGDVGGGVVMNAGVAEAISPREFCEIIESVEVLDSDSLEIRRFQATDLEWTYRHSSGWQPGIVVRATISWPLQVVDDIGERVKQATQNRLARQPLNQPSCGSTFKNPDPPKDGARPDITYKAGALIERAGLKGVQIGRAQISTKHANFIVNLGGARAADVMSLIERAQSEVKRQFGVELVLEARLLGRW